MEERCKPLRVVERQADAGRHGNEIHPAPRCIDLHNTISSSSFTKPTLSQAGSAAEWLVCSTQAQKGPGSNRSRDAVR